MKRKLRTRWAVGVAAVLCSVLSACSGVIAHTPNSGPVAAGDDPLAHLSADQIARKTVQDLRSATSVHYSGVITLAGNDLSLDFTVTSGGRNCQGTVAIGKTGTLQVIALGSMMWVRGDRPFWLSNNPAGRASAADSLADKWIKTSTSGSMSPFAAFCQTTNTITAWLSTGTPQRGQESTISGTPSIQLVGFKGGVTGYASDTAAPELLRVSGALGSPGTINLDDYNAPMKITPPPTEETVDGASLGL